MNRIKSLTALLASAGVLASFVVAQDGKGGAAAVENNAPSVNGIPGESIDEGGKFATIKLDNYVSDDMDKPEQIKWSVSGNKKLKVTIKDRVATIETPDKYWNGSEDITFAATDTKGAVGSETVNFTVESVNNPPVVSQIPDQTIDEGKQFAKITLDNYVSDPDHPKDQILWEFDIQPLGKDQADGDLNVEIDPKRVASVIIPDAHWYGSAKIKFTATDGEYASDSKTATFVVKPINDPPVLQKIPSQTIEEKNEFESISLSDFVSDVDDDISKLKWTISGNKDLKFDIDKYGTANIKIPNEYWNGSETVTFNVCDPANACAKSTATFTVKSVNDPPEFVKDVPDQTIDEKQEFKPIQLDQLVKDPDHSYEQLKWTVSGNKDLKVNISGKTATIGIPSKMWNGSESLKFKVCDPLGACAESESPFTVNSVNDKPEFVKAIPNQTIDEKKQFAKIKLDDYVKDADHKHSELSWEADVKHQGKMPESGTLNVNIDESRVASIEIPDTYWNGAAVVTFTCSDPEGASVKQEVTFTVKSINDLPVFKKIPDQTIEEKSEFASVILDEYLSDADHDISKLKIDVTGGKSIKAEINQKTREVTFKTPNELWNGSETLTFTAVDPDGGKASTSVKLTVKSINDPPVMKDIPEQTIKEKEQFKPIELDKYVEDLDHSKDKLKWTITGNRELKVTIDANRIVRVTPPSPQWNGAETINFKVSDPEGATDERSVAFTVESVNDVPVFVKPIVAQTIKEKEQFQPIKLGEMVKDADNKLSDLVFAVDVKPAPSGKNKGGDLTVEVDAQQVAKIIIPNKMWNGANEIVFTVSDPEGAKATAKAVFTVTSVNDVPTLKKIPDQMIEEKQHFAQIKLAELANDPDHAFNLLKWTVTGNKALVVDIDKDGVATIKTPSPKWNGSEKLTFTVTDPEGASAKSDAVFTVKSINDPPVMKDIPSQKIKEKEQFKTIALDDYASDLDHENAQLKWSFSGQKDLKISMDAKRVVTIATPNKYWHGSETVKFTVTDPEGAMDSRTVTFTAESVNDLPVFTKPIKDQTIQEKREFAIINLADVVTDPDHKPEQLTWNFKVDGAKGAPKGYTPKLVVKVDDKRMARIVIPDKYWNGSEQITFTVEDPEGGKASCTATFTVTSVNDAPSIGKIADQTVAEKQEFAPIDLGTIIKDPDHPFEKLKIEVSGNKDLKVEIAKDGKTVIKTPNKMWNGSEKLTFTVTDPEGASAKATAAFTVNSINDPPVMKDIANQTIKEKGSFKPIELDNFVEDLDHPKNKLKWKIEGAKELKVAMDAEHKVTVTQPNQFWHGKETIKFTVTDPEGASDSKSVVFEVESVNDAPVFVKELKGQSIDEKKQFQPIKLDDLINDPDHKKSDLKWSFDVKPVKVGAADAGKKGKKGKKGKEEEVAPKATQGLSVKVDAQHVATIVIPDKYWNGAADIVFTAKDPEGAAVSKMARFEVRSINDPPKISEKAPKGETIRENGRFTTIDLSNLATDPDHPAAALKWTFSGNKALKVNHRKDNTVEVAVPDPQWNGKEMITFTVTDPEGASANHKMVFEVTRVNDPPAFVKRIPDQKIKEKETFKPIHLDEYVKDPDNKPNELKWRVSGAQKLKAEISSGRVLTVTAPDKYFWCAPEMVVIEATDPDGASTSATITFEITSVNDAPILKDIPDQKIREKGEFKDIDLNKFVKDPDHQNHELKWTAVVSKPKGAAPAPEKKAAKKPAKKDVKKGAKKGEAEEAKEEAAPEPKHDDLEVEIDSRNFAHIKLPSKFWNGERNVTFTVTDPEGAKASKTVNFLVESVNDPPVMTAIKTQTINEKEKFKPIDLSGIASDPDHPVKSLKFEIGPTRQLKASIDKQQQLWVATPDKYWNGSEKITLTVTDPEGARATQQILFEVLPVNDPPTVKPIAGQRIKEKEKFEPIDLSKAASDPDNKPNELKWSVSGNKDLKVDIRGSRAMVVTPNPNWNGKETLTFTVKDPAGASASTNATFEVIAVNDPPVLKPIQPFMIEEKKTFAPVDFSKLVKDPDNTLEELTWSLDDAKPMPIKTKKGITMKMGKSSVKHEINFNISENGVLTAETPNKYWNGTEVVTVNVFDPAGAKASVDVKFIVKPVNDPPVVKEIPGQETLEGKGFKPIKLDEYVSDPDNKVHEIRWKVSGAKNLNVEISGGREAVIRPKKQDWFGEETLVFTATDPAGGSDKAVAKFVVKHVNSAPVMRDIPDYTIKEDDHNGVIAVIKLDQYARDKDCRFEELKWTFTGNKYLEVKYDKFKKTATVSQPHENWNGKPERITFTVTDPEGAKASRTALFTVVPVNDPPVAKPQTYMTQEGDELKVSASEGLMSGVVDPDGEKPVAAIVVQKPRNGKITVNERDGSFTYMPNKGFSGLDEFTFKVRDPSGAFSKIETAEINVSFKMKDLRGGDKKKEEPKAEEKKDDGDDKAAGDKPKKKRKKKH